MANNRIIVNGKATVYNAAWIYQDGKEMEINGFVQAIDFDEGNVAEHVMTINKKNVSIAINQVIKTPALTIRFAPGKFQTFYNMLNSGSEAFDLQLEEFVVGQYGKEKKITTFEGCKRAGKSGSISPSSPSNTRTVVFKCIDILD